MKYILFAHFLCSGFVYLVVEVLDVMVCVPEVFGLQELLKLAVIAQLHLKACW